MLFEFASYFFVHALTHMRMYIHSLCTLISDNGHVRRLANYWNRAEARAHWSVGLFTRLMHYVDTIYIYMIVRAKRPPGHSPPSSQTSSASIVIRTQPKPKQQIKVIACLAVILPLPLVGARIIHIRERIIRVACGETLCWRTRSIASVCARMCVYLCVSLWVRLMYEFNIA